MRSRRAFRIFDALLFVLKELLSYDYSVIPFTSEFYFPSIVHVYVRCCSFHAYQPGLTRHVQPSFGRGRWYHLYALCLTSASLTLSIGVVSYSAQHC